MSKFVNRLQNLSKSLTAAIGFHPTASEPKGSAMLLIAELSGTNVEEAKIVADVKADAGLILNQSFNTEIAEQMIESLGDVPLGICVKDVSEENVNKLGDLGCDFLVLDTKMPATMLNGKGVGKFLMIGPSLDQGLVRAVNSLDVDGVFLGCSEDSFITVEHLLIYQRFNELLYKPLIVMLPSLVNSDVLSNLWEARVSGIVIPAGQSSEAFSELRKVMDNLPKEAKHRRTNASPVLPYYSSAISIEGEEDEEI